MNGEMQPKTIVYVVDDDAAVRRGIVRLLRAAGHSCLEFESAEAYLAAQPAPCGAACLVLDIRMREMSGTELQRLTLGTEREIPIVFVTGHGDIPTCVRALKAGAVSFLGKPFDEGELLSAVGEALLRSAKQTHERLTHADMLARYRRLSPREREVFAGVVRGEANKVIAQNLSIAEKTVKIHRARVMEKMETESLAALVRLSGELERRGGGAAPDGGAS